MNVWYYLLYAIAYAVEPVLWMKIFSKLFHKRYEKGQYYFLGGLGLYFLFFSKQLITFHCGNDSVNSVGIIIQLLYLLRVLKRLFETKRSERLLIIGVLALLSIVMDSIFLLGWVVLFRQSMDTAIQFGLVNVILTFFARGMGCLLYGFCFSRIVIVKRVRQLFYYREVIPLVILHFALSVPSWLLFHNREFRNGSVKVMQFMYTGTLWLFAVTTLYIIWIINKRNKTELANKLTVKQMSMELEMYSEISEVTEKLSDLRHDMRSHIGLMKSLCDNQEYHRMGEYLRELYQEVELSEDLLCIENKTIAIVLRQKHKLAKEKGISFYTKVMVKELPMKDVDICSLLSNIVNNAIEAAEKQLIGEGYVDLCIMANEHGYHIRCENSFAEKPVQIKNSYVTSKKDADHHGLGIGIIKKITEKYAGTAKIYCEETCFIVEVYIPIEERRCAEKHEVKSFNLR
ncbi:sensor histidine kinase [Anaeromicropila populeti]|uniref:GHKL domain-containing protein n=1 Tax=Anaeromicropila populeti TaxID=37658 RepID=A0A1I6LDF7_9FIRM|nr:sensor histidine kinase [Anaeromicropila populeti]SFS01466.1 GHKL domain-containing protein [Anaeromicropila populeti]